MRRFIIGVVPLLLLTGGCATLTIDTRALDKPISMTSKVDSQHYKTIHHLEKDISSYWLLGIIPLSQPNLSKALMEEIHKYRGSGTVNVRFKATTTWKDLAILIISGGTIQPVSFIVEGDIIKFKK